MRTITFAALFALGACAVTAPQPCGCLPPRPQPIAPVAPVVVAAGVHEPDLVLRALEAGCRDMGAPDARVDLAQRDGWLRIVPESAYANCAVEVEGPSDRIAAMDEVLLAYAEALDLTWNVRDSRPLWNADGRREIKRTRGETGLGEPEMSWTFVEVLEASDRITTLRLEWQPAPGN